MDKHLRKIFTLASQQKRISFLQQQAAAHNFFFHVTKHVEYAAAASTRRYLGSETEQSVY